PTCNQATSRARGLLAQHLHFAEQFDALVYRRVCIKEVVQEALVVVQRVREVELRRRLVRRFEGLLIVTDLLERAGECAGIAAKQRARGVGEVRSLAADREVDS